MTDQAAPSSPSMTKVLENVDAELSKDPNVNRFAPPKLRQQALNNGELENIQHDLRKNFAEAAELHKRLQAYCDSLKTAIDALTRSAS